MKTVRNSAGVTLIEMIFSMAILAIVSGFAAQYWGHWLEQSRHRQLTVDYRSLFAFARSSAIHSHRLITLCPLSESKRCIDDWNRPVSIFPDNNNDKRPDDDTILRKLTLRHSTSHVYSRTAGRGYFQFTPEGMTHGSMGSLVLCSGTNTQSTVISYMAINLSGRFRVLHDDDGNGTIDLPWGTKLTCPS